MTAPNGSAPPWESQRDFRWDFKNAATDVALPARFRKRRLDPGSARTRGGCEPFVAEEFLAKVDAAFDKSGSVVTSNGLKITCQ